MVLFYDVFGFFPSLLMHLEKRIEFFSYILLAFAAEHFSSLAPAFPFVKFGVIFFEEEKVVLEYTADCRVSACFALFGRSSFAACESIPDFLFHDLRLVGSEYACFGHGRAHFSASAQAWKEAAVDLSRFEVT